MLQVQTLGSARDREGFDCGVEPLNRCLREVARQLACEDIADGIGLFVDPKDQAAAEFQGVWLEALEIGSNRGERKR